MIKLGVQEVCQFFDCPHRSQCFGSDENRFSSFICEIYGIDLNICSFESSFCPTCE